MPDASRSRRKRRPAPLGGLRYSRDGEKGYRREPSGKGFAYVDVEGS